jgi:hypothetical protein
MQYVELNVGEKQYKLRLGAQQTVEVEKKLGESVLTVMMKMGDGKSLMELEKLLVILHGALQKYEHGITITNVYDIYDDFVDQGGSFMDLVEKLIDLLTVSGFFGKAQVEEMKNLQTLDKKVKSKK